MTMTREEVGRGLWGKEAEGSRQGTCTKDPWTRTMGREAFRNAGWIGQGTAMGGKCGQL